MLLFSGSTDILPHLKGLLQGISVFHITGSARVKAEHISAFLYRFIASKISAEAIQHHLASAFIGRSASTDQVEGFIPHGCQQRVGAVDHSLQLRCPCVIVDRSSQNDDILLDIKGVVLLCTLNNSVQHTGFKRYLPCHALLHATKRKERMYRSLGIF